MKESGRYFGSGMNNILLVSFLSVAENAAMSVSAPAKK